MKQTKYSILFYKIMNLTCISILFIGFQNNSCSYCPDRLYNSFISQLYSRYFLKCVFHVFGMAEIMFEILVVYERYCVLNNVNSVLYKISIKNFYFVTLLIFTILRIPDYLAYEIRYSTKQNNYYIAKTSIGNSRWCLFYNIILDLGFYGICITFGSTINILNIIAYRNFVYHKNKMLKNQKRVKKAEVVFTRMVIMSTIFEITALFFNLLSFFIIEIYLLNQITYSPFANLNQTISYEVLFITFIVDILLYLYMDRNLNRSFKNIRCC